MSRAIPLPALDSAGSVWGFNEKKMFVYFPADLLGRPFSVTLLLLVDWLISYSGDRLRNV